MSDTLYLDDGWEESNGAWYKGYSLDGKLSESISDIVNGARPNGIWCVILNGVVYHPKLRGFPLFTNGVEYTNLPKFDRTNSAYTLIPQTSPYAAVDREKLISLDDAAEKVAAILVDNSTNFVKFNSYPSVTVLYSGGIDSATTWAAFGKASDTYQFKISNPVSFTRAYSSLLLEYLKNHWGYRMTSTFNESCYTTGFYSEVMQFREVSSSLILAAYLKANNKDVSLSSTDYLYHFMKRDSVAANAHKFTTVAATEAELFAMLFGTTLYDYQMWHIDNNIHFSPFYDIRIPEVMAQLSVDDLYLNCKTAIVQRKVIALLEPHILSLVADFKNAGDVFTNYRKNFNKETMLPSTVTMCS